MRHRRSGGFVILPDAFADGKLSRDAWRAVKACLSTVRTRQRPSGLQFRAVAVGDTQAEPRRSTIEVPIRATWVEVWRAIHRVHGRGTLSGDAREHVGVAVEPLRGDAGERNRN